ncbi:DNA-binding transcriptional LysR family regulator [Scopulibacillus darangshiensis]|uniref:DNA-binding transcriptional LysR family regulator n=1 Tax=Scopulibacillus darangshiensis TaxID=442528 RepID=A0A4R2NZT5_9BACL|nr:LysR family transcriptional regulator [Scopulibacillus darangshiensis]TCP27071.1 DNA-binding transcriptional LysR family regulator [Scopulibacillus darangshiensis]
MDQRDWHILQLLYQKKNITKTAQSLYISQPTLTNRLQHIEREFGVKIVNRGRRGVQFTPQGEYLAKCADDMLLNMRKIKEKVLNMGENISGTLRLGVSHSFTHYKLPTILKHFKERYPAVEFKVTTAHSADVINLAYNQDVHIGFVRGNVNWQGQQRLLFEETISVVSKKSFKLSDLPRLPRIDYHTDYMLKGLIDHWWSAHFTQPPLISMEVDKAETCKDMVINGLGYAIMPSMILNDLDHVHRIDIETKAGDPILRKTWMIYYEEFLEIKLVTAFVDFIEEVNFIPKN